MLRGQETMYTASQAPAADSLVPRDNHVGGLCTWKPGTGRNSSRLLLPSLEQRLGLERLALRRLAANGDKAFEIQGLAGRLGSVAPGLERCWRSSSCRVPKPSWTQ